MPPQENYAYAHMLDQHGLCAHEPEFQAYSVLLTGDIKQATKGYAGVSHSPEVRPRAIRLIVDCCRPSSFIQPQTFQSQWHI